MWEELRKRKPYLDCNSNLTTQKKMNRYFLFILTLISFSATAQQYRLDSLVHTVKGRQFITSTKNDTVNKQAEIIRYQREDPDAEIQKTERVIVRKNESGNDVYSVFALWNPAIKNWDEYEKTETAYNADNKITHSVMHRKKNNEWVKEFENIRIYTKDSITQIDYELREDKFRPIHKNITVVNPYDNVKYYEIFLWNDTTQNWRSYIKTENLYKNDTILTGYATYEWKENQWQNQEKVAYEFDQNGKRTDNYTTYKQNGNDWTPIDKLEHIELPETKKKISRIYKWSEADNDWIVRSQTETFLNYEGKKQDVLFSSLDTTTNQLKLELEQMHFYDREGRLTTFQEFYHAKEKITGTQSTVKFDEDGNVYHEGYYELDAETDKWTDKVYTEISFYKNIVLDTSLGAHKKLDFFGLNYYNYITNKNAVEQVKVYQHKDGEKILSEEYEYFYSEME